MRIPPVLRGLVAALLLTLALSQAAIASSAADAWFAPTSIWNRKLAADAPLAPSSGAYVQSLVDQVNGWGPWINTADYSVPVYRVGRKMPTRKVFLERGDGSWIDPKLKRAFSRVPIPGRAEGSGGEDSQLVIWQPSRDRMWELAGLSRQGGRWVAGNGGAMRNVSKNPGFYDGRAWPGAEDYWGATATGLPLVGGLMTIEELKARKIEHALAMAIPEPSPESVWPASRSDGYVRDEGAIPEGTIFRLPASVDVDALNLRPIVRAFALAAQEYGIVVRDKSGAVVFYGEDPGPTGKEPYPRIFEGAEPSDLMRQFPWSQLVAVKPGT